MSNSPVRGGGGMLTYFVSPLALVLPIILVTALGGRFSLSDIPPRLTAGVAIIFCVTSGFYVLLCRKGMIKPAVALGLAVDGMLLVFFSFVFSSNIVFEILGFIVVITGILVGMSAAAPGEVIFARKVESILPHNMGMDELHKIIDAIQFPCVFMERGEHGVERVAAFNQPFALEFGLDKSRILGGELEDLLHMKLGSPNIEHKGEEWVIKRTERGSQILVMLSPAIRSKEAARIEVFDSIDVSTGLYNAGFMKYKAKSDIESVNRGKRRLAAVMFKLTFPGETAGGELSEEQKLAAAVMGRMVQSAIRVCDSAFRISDTEVLLIMPDTAQSGTKIVISRVYTLLKQASTVECPGLSKAVLVNVERDYVGGTDLPQYEKILEELLILFNRAHPEFADVRGADAAEYDPQ